MSVREYVGARYVPLFADPLDWDSTKTYEPLTIVYHQGNSFTSRQYVPAGIDITNESYWALTGNYNAQIESYRAEVARFDARITANADAIAAEETARENADTTLGNRITAEETARENADTTLADEISNDIFNNISLDNMHGLWRIPIEINNIRYSMQGCCAFKNGTDIISVCYIEYNDTNGYLISFLNGVKVSQIATDRLHHGNSIAYANGYIYIPNNSSVSTIFKMKIETNGRLSGVLEIACTSTSGSIVFDNIAQKFYQIGSNEIREIDINTGSILNRTNLSSNTNIQNNATGQSATVFYVAGKKYFGLIYSMPNFLSVWNENGKFVTNIEIPLFANYVCLGEPEGISFFDDGTFVVFANEPPASNIFTKTCYAFVGNIFDKSEKLFTKESPHTATFINAYPSVIDLYPFPTANEGSIDSSNPIKVSYMQDCQFIIDALTEKNAAIYIEEDGAPKNGLLLSGVKAYVHFQHHVLSAAEFRYSFIQAHQTAEHMNDTNFDNQRIRVIYCPYFASRYTSSNSLALYASGSTVFIPSAMNSVIVTANNCFIVNPSQ